MTTTKRQFTWQELASLNKEHNAHIAVRGKVRKAQTLHNDQVLLSMNVHVAHLLVLSQNSNTFFDTQLEIQNSSQQTVIRINFKLNVAFNCLS